MSELDPNTLCNMTLDAGTSLVMRTVTGSIVRSAVKSIGDGKNIKKYTSVFNDGFYAGSLLANFVKIPGGGIKNIFEFDKYAWDAERLSDWMIYPMAGASYFIGRELDKIIKKMEYSLDTRLEEQSMNLTKGLDCIFMFFAKKKFSKLKITTIYLLCILLFSAGCTNARSPNRFTYCHHAGILYEGFMHQSLEIFFDEICGQINSRKDSCSNEGHKVKTIKRIKHKCFAIQRGNLVSGGGNLPLLVDSGESISTSFTEGLKGNCILQSFIDINLKEEFVPFVTVYCLEGTYIVSQK